MTARVLVRLCAAALVLAALAGCAGSSPDVPLGPDGEPDPQLLLGRDVFSSKCATCHGSLAIGIGGVPDLRRSPMPVARGIFDDVVRGGALVSRGMPAFEEFSEAKLENIRHYILSQAEELRTRESRASAGDGKPAE